MRIAPLPANYYKPQFTSRQDLSDKLKERISQGLSSLIDGENDEFVPVQPTQPIIVKEVKIYKKEDSGKGEAVATGVGGIGGGIGISKLKKGKGAEENTNNDTDNDKKIDYDKIADESAQETRTNIDDSYSDINDTPDEDLVIDCDDDTDDYDEE